MRARWSILSGGHEAPHHLRQNEHSRRAAYSFPFGGFTYSLRSPTSRARRAAASSSGFQIRFSSVCAHSATCSSGLRPMTRKPCPPRDQSASEELPALFRARRRVRRPVGDDAEQNRRARGVDVGDHGQRRTVVRENERRREAQARERHLFGRQFDAHLAAEGCSAPAPGATGRGSKARRSHLCRASVYSTTAVRQSSLRQAAQGSARPTPRRPPPGAR